MKKFLLLAAIILSAATSFARDLNNRAVAIAFNKEFAGATNVNWFEADDNYMAKFTLNARKVTAHFDADGNLLATSQVISDLELPIPVINRLIRKFPDQKIHNILEFVVDGQHYYAITLESDSKWTSLKANAAGDITVVKKLQKA